MRRIFLSAFAGVFLPSTVFALDPARTAVVAEKEMIAAADPRAVKVGLSILEKGGSAVDAVIATQLVLNLVEPQSSGIGGGSLLLFYDKASQKITALDGREKAPAAAKPDRFMKDGKALTWDEAYPGGRSVGVPGTPRVLEAAHKKWGKLPWGQVLQPAIDLAEQGYEISPRLYAALNDEAELFAKDTVAKDLFYAAEGKAKAVGTVVKNPAFAQTLKIMAQKGADGFYKGAIAEDIVRTVTQSPSNPGDMTLADLEAYDVKEREVLCGPYRLYKVCGFGPPTSGGIAVGQILGILNAKDMASLKGKGEAVHWFTEAGRLAYADRNLYVADSDFVDVPVKGLLDQAYLQARANMMSDKSLGVAQAGTPNRQSYHFAPYPGIEHGTSHISIIDKDGNAVAMTTTVEYRFGSQIMTKGGFVLNNQLTDFAWEPMKDGKPIANALAANKRPRSSMSPTIILDKDNQLWAVVGSPGGPQIINYTAQAIVGMVDWNLDPQQAVSMGHFGSRNNGPTELEENSDAVFYKSELESKGHATKVMKLPSGLNVLQVRDGKIWGGSDPRQEGIAAGR